MPRPSGRRRAPPSVRSASAPSSASKADAERLRSAVAARRRARRIYSTADIMRAIHRMVAEITPHLAHTNPVVLAVMQGGVFTALQICARLPFPHEFDYV